MCLKYEHIVKEQCLFLKGGGSEREGKGCLQPEELKAEMFKRVFTGDEMG